MTMIAPAANRLHGIQSFGRKVRFFAVISAAFGFENEAFENTLSEEAIAEDDFVSDFELANTTCSITKHSPPKMSKLIPSARKKSAPHFADYPESIRIQALS